MFDLDEFVAECASCTREAEPRRAIREVLSRAVARPTDIADRLPPESAGLTLLYHSDDLTVLNVVWAPGMKIFPHDHRMWAAIAIYTGTEDNEFFRRPESADSGLVPSGAKRLATGDVALLGDDTVHTVTNPNREATGAIHVYGGDFVNQPRSQWLPPEHREEPWDGDRVRATFAAANETWQRG